MLGRLPDDQSLEDGLASVAQRMVERLKAAPPDRQKKLLTDAFLLTGLRVRRDIATKIFRGVRAMHESDTYLAILDEGQEKATKKAVLVVGQTRLGPPDESVKIRLNQISDLERLERMVSAAVTATDWQEILDTP